MPLGEWVLHAACKQSRAWRDAGQRGVPIAVNVSSHQFRQTNLVQVVEGITRSLPDLPIAVVTERNIMARNLLMHTCADVERAFAEGAGAPRRSWSTVGFGLIDAIVGLLRAPVTEHP